MITNNANTPTSIIPYGAASLLHAITNAAASLPMPRIGRHVAIAIGE